MGSRKSRLAVTRDPKSVNDDRDCCRKLLELQVCAVAQHELLSYDYLTTPNISRWSDLAKFPLPKSTLNMASTVATPVANGGDRRRSGRAVQAPPNFSQELHYGSVAESAKRKRVVDDAEDSGNEVEADDSESESESDQENDDGEPDEEELREKRRKQRKPQKVAKPAAKRPKTTSKSNTTLAIRSANAPTKNVSKAAQKKARSRPSQMQETGIFADVFGKGNDAETAAISWHNKLEADHVGGIVDIVNLILQTVGCEGRVDTNDIEDVDNVPARLSDILDQYNEQKEGDYPLSGKQKQYHGMKEVFSDFFRAVSHALHNSGLFYEEPAIYDNIHVWTATMSGAQFRSFRVTATIASLALTTGLAEVAQELHASVAASKSQLDAEKKKKKANESRISKLKEEMTKENKKLEIIDKQLEDAFNTVFVHRYRDVEEKLRVECAKSLGTWILLHRHMFLEGSYLRYLGWVMSDPYAPTRFEVIRQLKSVYKIRGNLSALRGFTDRFRSRLVEMGSRDADISVRVETIELIRILRSAELLEPDDIDTIGQLIFDSEAQVRKAVAQFFVSNIQDLYEASIEDLDKEEFEATLPDVENLTDFDEPCKLWIKFKCLAQTLASQTKDLANTSHHKIDVSGVDHLDSRYMVATQSVFDVMPELSEWESLAGYLLYDHSNSVASDATDVASAIREAYKLESGEELILLDVLFCAAKLYLSDSPLDKTQPKSKMTSKDKQQLRERQETAAHNLSAFIPKLHSKFGSIAQAARSILRLNQLFNPDIVVDEEEGEIDRMVSDIGTRFSSHSDPEVLTEACRALRAVLMRESSRAEANREVSKLWNAQTSNTAQAVKGLEEVELRCNLDSQKVQQLADAAGRLAQLASVKDCTEAMEERFKWVGSKNHRKNGGTIADVLIRLIHRGQPDEDADAEIGQYEDQACTAYIKTLLFYYRWKLVEIKKAVADNDSNVLNSTKLSDLEKSKSKFVQALSPVISSRKPLDQVRITSILNLLDLYILIATLRNSKPDDGSLDDEVQSTINSLVSEVDGGLMAAIMDTHEKMEKRLARRLNKKNVELPLAKAQRKRRSSGAVSATPAPVNGHVDDEDIERPPEDSDDEDIDAATHARASDADESSDDGDEVVSDSEEGLPSKDAKRKAVLVAETSLCELTAKIVLALLARVVPNAKEVKARLQVNRTKLGKSYTQVIAYADDKKEKAKKSRASVGPKTPVKGGAKSKKPTKKAAPVSEQLVLSDDDIEDPDEVVARDDDDPDRLREQGLDDDDPIDDNAEEAEDRDADNDDDDEIMGD